MTTKEHYIKKCSSCELKKHHDDFYNNNRRPDGKDNICKVCRRVANKKAYLARTEKAEV